MAARLAVEAYAAAADPRAFRSQITREGLRPWRVRRLYRDGADGEGKTGPGCAASFTPAVRTDEVFGVWSGRRTLSRRTWAQVERDAQRDYVTQGWAGLADPPADPADLGCDEFTQLASRVPYTPGGSRRDAMLEGALRTRPSGLPLGTELFLTARRFGVVPGGRVALTVHARGPRTLGPATVRLRLPGGWRGPARIQLGGLRPERETRATVRLAVPRGASVNRRVRVGATLAAGGRAGATRLVLGVVPPIRGTLAPRAQVADFRAWTARTGLERLDTLVDPVVTLPSGGTRTLRVEVRDDSGTRRRGTVALRLPAGFAADAPEKPFRAPAAGARRVVTFAVTNTDTALPDSEEGGDRPFEIVTATAGARSVERAALELVPAAAIPRAAAAPAVDGVETPGEYPGAAIDVSRRWEGEAPHDAADASGAAKLAWTPDALHVLVLVTDDVLGAILPASDARRHWRTDSVEIAVDPRGDAADTASTYKVGVFPVTAEGGPAAARDADNRQGPAASTSPGLQVASRLGAPYDGYTIEVAIPFADLPAAVAPGGFGLDVLVYDSDTQDKTGQTRLGWSAWGGVQGDPYRWGRVTLAGPGAPEGGPAAPAAPVLPRAAARSLDSPPSVLQAARQGLGLGGGPLARTRVRFAARPRFAGGVATAVLRASGPGVAHLFATAGRRAGRGVGGRVRRLRQGTTRVRIRVRAGVRPRAVAVGFAAAGGGTRAVAARVRG
jgi:hypothetical protein